MRLLFVCPDLPYPPTGGPAVRIWSLLSALAGSHTLGLVALGSAGERVPEALAAICEVSLVEAPPERSAAAWLAERDAELPWAVRERESAELARVVAERSASADAVVASTFAMVPYLERVEGPLRVYDAHNVESDLLEQIAGLDVDPLVRLHAHRESARTREYERSLADLADLVLAVSGADAAALRTLAPAARVRTLPIALVTRDYPPLRSGGSPRLALFGDMGWPPNVDAARYLCREILPRLGSPPPAVIAGRRPAPAVRALAAPGVTVTGPVADMPAVLRGDTIAVTPLRGGSGMRVKTLEAMAWGLPVVSTPVGYAGIDHGGALLEADGADALAEAIETLLHDPERRAALGRAGRERVAALYGHERCGGAFLTALEELL